MSPKEEAISIFDSFYLELREHGGFYDLDTARQCAIITVKKIISSHNIEGSGIDREIFKHYAQVINEIDRL